MVHGLPDLCERARPREGRRTIAKGGGERKLAAILSADVVGYSKLMADDERATVKTIQDYRLAIARVIERHKGRVVDAPGDNILADFPSAVESVESACEIQEVLKGRNLELPAERRMEFRIGVNLGDVIEEPDGTIYGDGVNIAARMEALAETGGVCISSSVYDAVEGKIDFGFDFLGAQRVKNIAKPVNVYRVRADKIGTPTGMAATGRLPWRRMVAAAVLVLAITGTALWQMAEPPETAPGPDALPLPDQPSIVVLPFTNLSDDPEQAYFADGITEDVITALSRFTEMFVIARNSSFKYRGKIVDIGQVGRELGVRYVLEGSVRRSGDQVRITAQLIDSTTVGHLWSETYDRKLADIFEVQAEIAQRIAGVLAPRIAEDVYKRALHKMPADLTAFESVGRARKLLASMQRANLEPAGQFLTDAIARDPDYALAHALLAAVHMRSFTQATGDEPGTDLLEEAGRLAKRAVELGPFEHTNHRALSEYYFFTKQLDLFEAEAKKALDLNPNDAGMLAMFAVRFAQVFGRERLGETEEMIRRAMRLDPHHPSYFHDALVRMFFFTGRYEEAQAQINKADLPEDYAWRHYWTALIQAQLGNLEAASTAAERFMTLQPGATMQSLIGQWNLHESYWDTYMEAADKAGIPLGTVGENTPGSH